VKYALPRFKADLFKALAHPTRVRILELLRQGERTVTELQASLEIEPSSVSQQLAVLRSKNLIEGRKDGTSVYYSVRDPELFMLLDIGRRIFNNHLGELQTVALESDGERSSAG
jgi:DNA-binding transcriptional ArsR family regulator